MIKWGSASLPELPAPTGHQDLGCPCPRGGKHQQGNGVPYHLPPLPEQEKTLGNGAAGAGGAVAQFLGRGTPGRVKPTLHKAVGETGAAAVKVSRDSPPPQPVVARLWAQVQPPADCPRGPTPVRTCSGSRAGTPGRGWGGRLSQPGFSWGWRGRLDTPQDASLCSQSLPPNRFYQVFC